MAMVPAMRVRSQGAKRKLGETDSEVEMRMTMAEVLAHQARVNKAPASERAPYDGEESDVHQKIIEHCKRMGWVYRRDRMDRASTGQVGWPDFSIACRDGKAAFIECKRKGGKPTTEQAGTIHWLKSLGHVAAVVWSYEEFCEVVKGLR